MFGIKVPSIVWRCLRDLDLAVLVELQLVKDKRMDVRHTMTAYTALA